MTTTNLATELARHFNNHFRVLILDNEVTVDAFATDPPLPWVRLTARDGVYRIGKGFCDGDEASNQAQSCVHHYVWAARRSKLQTKPGGEEVRPPLVKHTKDR